MTVASRRRETGLGMPNLLLAAILLIVALAAPRLPMPIDLPLGARTGTLAALLNDPVICHAGDQQDGSAQQAPSRHPFSHGHECGLCPVCHFMGAPVLITSTGASWLPPTAEVDARQGLLPPATFPPRQPNTAARPRGPPALSA